MTDTRPFERELERRARVWALHLVDMHLGARRLPLEPPDRDQLIRDIERLHGKLADVDRKLAALERADDAGRHELREQAERAADEFRRAYRETGRKGLELAEHR